MPRGWRYWERSTKAGNESRVVEVATHEGGRETRWRGWWRWLKGRRCDEILPSSSSFFDKNSLLTELDSRTRLIHTYNSYCIYIPTAYTTYSTTTSPSIHPSTRCLDISTPPWLIKSLCQERRDIPIAVMSLSSSSRLLSSSSLVLPVHRFFAPAISPLVHHRYSSSSSPVDEEEEQLARARTWIANLSPSTIPKSICDISYSRSSGPGGQNVNK